MLHDLPHPAIIAHRGASARAPENTLASFKLAEEAGTDGVELDAKLTADGAVVVFHDITLERTTNGAGRLSQQSLSHLRELDAGSHYAGAFRGEKIPLLEEVFEAVGNRLMINIELTNYTTLHDALVQKVCELVRKHGVQGRVIFSSFYAGNLRQAAHLLPEVPRGLLAGLGWQGAWARSFGFSFGDYAALHPNVADVSRQQVQRVHRLGRRINVWTVNDPDDIRRLAEWGVDGIFTDDPGRALQVVGRRG